MSAKYDGRNTRPTNEVKRYKMYKSGRQWITAGLTTLTLAMGFGVAQTTTVSADVALEKSDTVSGDDDKAEVSSSEDDSATSAASESVTVAQAQADLSEANSEVASAQATADAAADDLNQTLDDNEIAAKSLSGTDATAQGATPETANDATVNKDEQDVTDTAHQESDTTSGQVQTGAQPDDVTPKSVNESETSVTSTATTVDAVALSQWQNEAQTAAQEHVDDINEILDQSNTQADADSTDSIERNLAIVALTTHVNQQSSQVKTLTNSATETTDLTAYQELVTKVTSILANMQSEIATAATLVAADKKGVSAAQVKTATVAFDQLVLPDGTVGELSAYGDLVISVAHGSGASFEDAVQAIETQGLTSSFRSIVDPESATYTLVGGDTFTNQTNTTISAGATDFNANSNYVTSTGNGTNAGKQSAYSTTDVLWNLLDDPGSNANATRSFNSALSTVADFTVSGYVTIYNEDGKVSSVGGYASLINPAASTDFAGLILSEKINPVIKQVQSSATNSTAPTGQTTGGGQSYSAGVNPWKRYLITVSTTTTDVGTVNNTTDVAETSSSKVNSWNKVAVTYTYTAGNGKLVALVTYTDANGSTTTVTATYTVDKNVVKQLYVSLGSEVTSNTKNNSSYGAITSIKGTYVTAPVTVNYTGLPTSIASSTITNNVVGSEISVNSDNSGFHIEAADNTYTSARFPTVAGYHVASVTNNNGNLVGTDGVTMTVTYAADVQTANVTYNTLNGAGEIVSSTTVTQNGTTGGTFNIATPAKSGYTASATAITGKYDNTNNGISTTDGTSQDYIVTYTPQVQQAFVDYITYGVDGISYTLTQSEVVSGVTGGTFDIETPAKIGYTVDHTAFTGTFDNTENGTNLVDNTPQTLVVTYTPTAITTTYQYQLPDGSTHTLGTSTTAAGETITIPSNIQSALTAVLLPTQKVNGANTADYTENEDGTWSAIYTIGVTARVQLKIATVVLKSDYDGSTVDNSFKTFIGSDGQAYYIVAEAGDGQDVNEGKAYIGDKPNSTLPDIVKNGTDKAATVGLAPYGYVLGQDIYYDTFGNKTVADTYTTQNAIAEADGSYTHYLLIVATPETVTATVKYVDDDLNGEEVATGEISGLTGTVYSVDGDTIYDANKYAFSSVDKGSGSLAVTEDGNVPGIITVHLTHKHETGTTSVTQTVSYTGLPSDKALADKTQIVNFTTDEDLVTGVVTYTQETTAAAIMTPTVSGYTPSITSVAGAAVETSTIAPTDIATTVVYTANNQTIKVIYVDDDNSEGEVASSSFTVPSDGLISFTADVPTNYVVVSTDTPENADSDDTVDQIITVHLKHAKEQVTQTTTATVTYAISGGEADAPDPDVLTVTWTADKDLVTGVISDYTPDITTYTVSTLKKVAGYTATQATVTQTFVNSATPENVSVAVTLVADSETPSESTRTVADTTKVDDALAAVDMVVAGSEEDAAAIDEAKAAAEEAKTALEDAAAAAASNAANDKLDEVKNDPTSTVEDIESAAQAAAEAKDASEAANAKVEEAQVAADDAAGDLAEAINTAKENNGESTSASVVTSTSVSVSESRSTSASVSLADSTSQSDSVSAVASKSSSTKLSDSVSSATSESVSAVASESSSTKLSESVSSATSESNSAVASESVSAVASESSSTKLSESVSSATSESVSAVASESASAKLSESISSATSESISAVASESSSTKLSESTSSATSESVSAVASESASAKLSESTSSATSESVSAVTSESSSTKLSESTSSATSESVSAVASESSSTKLSESTSSATSESVSAVASESASAKLSESTSNATSESVSAVASETSSTKLSGSVSSATSESVSAVASESTSAKLSESVSSATSESVSDSRSMSTSVSLADSTSRSDSVSDSRSTSTSVSLADSTSQSNSVSDSRSMSTSVSLTDSTTKSESVSNSDSISKSESISNSDSTSKSDSISNSDSTSKSDSISNSDSTSKSDSISNSESTSKSDSISNSDSTLKSESVSNNDSTSKSESVSNSDSTSKSESISNSDSTLKSESVSNSDSTSKSESVSNSDSTSKSESISNSDSMSKSESISNSESTSKSESISNSESTSKSESISNSDSTSKSESTSESAVTSTSVSESDSRSMSASVSLADSTSQSDSVSDSRSMSTSVSLSDSTTKSESTSKSESISNSELTSKSESISNSDSTSKSDSTSESAVTSTSVSESDSRSMSASVSLADSTSQSDSVSDSRSMSTSVSLTDSTSQSDSVSDSRSTSTSVSLRDSTTKSESISNSDSTSKSDSTSESAVTSTSVSESDSKLASDSVSDSRSTSSSVSLADSTSQSDSVSDGRSTSTSLSLRDSTANSESTSTVASDLASNSVSLSTKNSTSTTITSENVSTSEYSELNSTKSSESLSTSSSQANESQSLSTVASDEISTSLSERISASDSLSTAESTSAVIVSEHNATSVKLSDATSLSESTAIVNQSDSTSVRVMPSDEISTSESKSQSVSEFTSEFDSTLTSLHRSEVSSERQSKSQVDDTTGNIVMKNQATDRVQTLESTTGSNMTAKLTTTAPTISAEKVTSTNSLSVPSQATVLKGLLPENPKIITARRILIGQYETGDKFNIRLILEILTPLILILGFLLAAKRRKKEDDAETK